jgi:hypothetical protein
LEAVEGLAGLGEVEGALVDGAGDGVVDQKGQQEAVLGVLVQRVAGNGEGEERELPGQLVVDVRCEGRLLLAGDSVRAVLTVGRDVGGFELLKKVSDGNYRAAGEE